MKWFNYNVENLHLEQVSEWVSNPNDSRPFSELLIPTTITMSESQGKDLPIEEIVTTNTQPDIPSDGEISEEEEGEIRDDSEQDIVSVITNPEDHELVYLTPEMIEIFRHSELFELSKLKEQEQLHEVVEFNEKEQILESLFKQGENDRNPRPWPAY